MKRITIRDVAARAGVSNATVSAVLNEKGSVRASTRRKVLAAIEHLNYRPSASARRRFQPVHHKSIGLVVKEIDNPYYADIFEGARGVASQQGYTVLIASSEGLFESERTIVDMFASKDIDGLILSPVLDDEADLSHVFEIKRRNIPFVLLEKIRGLQASLVDVDTVDAAKKAAKYLIEQGHQHIVHFAGPRYSLHSDEKIEGVRRAFSESHLVFTENVIVRVGARLMDGYKEGLRYFGTSESRPTAVTCYNDLVAIGLLKALDELRIRVPDDVAVIGFDDINLSEIIARPLTSIRVPRVEMGARATEILIRHIEQGGRRNTEKVYLDSELVIRSTTHAPGVPVFAANSQA